MSIRPLWTLLLVFALVGSTGPSVVRAQVTVDPSRLTGDLDKIATVVKGGGTVWDVLTAEDKRYEPDPGLHGVPSVPINCDPSDDAQACYECIRQARARLEEVRFKLEKNRAIYLNAKTMVERAKAFGDGYGSLPGQGLGWYVAWRKIQSGWKNLQETYDAKTTELLDGLKTALQDISRCEEEHYGVPNWYSRFGFMYYASMETRYDRLSLD
jgi:hypothetical protein